MSEANKQQVGGTHYKQEDNGEEHWDRVHRLKLDYFQGQITKYVERCWKKHGLQDLKKARHFLDKYIELNQGHKGDAELHDIPHATPDASMVINIVQQVKPTAWVGFMFEGADARGFLYTCRKCGAKIYVAPHHNPYTAHQIQDNCTSITAMQPPPPTELEEPTKAYVNQ